MANIVVPRRSNLLYWSSPRHPIFRLEVQRLQRNQGLKFLQYSFNPIVLAGISLTITIVLVVTGSAAGLGGIDNMIEFVLAWTIGILFCVQIVAGAFANVLVIAQMSPSISGEMELQSWRLLRTTTLNIREIIFAKFAAGLVNLRFILVGLLVLRSVTVVCGMLMFAYVLFRQTLYYFDPATMTDYFVQMQWLPVVVPAGVASLVLMVQPIVQFGLNGVIGMIASAYARTRAQAVAMGLTARLALWVFTVLLNVAAGYGLGFLMSSWASPSSAPIAAFHGMESPGNHQIAWAFGLIIAFYLVAVIAGQIGATVAGFGLVLRRAQRLGV